MTARRAKRTATVETARVGKDEMNLSEFPIAILGNRAPEGVKTLRFQDRHGRLTVTGSDALGLPTAIDADVVVALIELTKKRNNFTEQTVHFTRYELIHLLGWANVGSSYDRIYESLNRWAGVLLMYDGCWWDNRSKSYVSKTFHIIESVIIAEGKTEAIKAGAPTTLPTSSFTWSKDFIRSCQDNNLKDLDTSLYFSLKLPSSKQLFRFLDKRFYRHPQLVFDLAEIAFERVGLSRRYSSNTGKIKEKLSDALEELESRGFLKPLSREERYFKTDHGWKIRMVDGRCVASTLPAPTPETAPSPLTAELIRQGVHKDTAAELVRRHPAEIIGLKLEVFAWMVGKKDKRIEKNPAGYLVTSIEKDYVTPKGFVSKAEQRRRKQQEMAAERAEDEAVAAYRKALTPEALARLEAEAIANASEEIRQSLDEPHMRPFRKTQVGMLLNAHIRQLLRNRQPTEDFLPG